MGSLHKRLCLLAALALLSIALYMTYGAQGSWSFVLPFRGTKLVGLILVAVSISTATVLFQTITQNRILTPSIVGFDALYILILTATIYTIGSRGYLQIPIGYLFLINAGALMLAALVLFTTVLNHTRNDLVRMVLVGIVLATLFRSLSSFFGRVLDPSEYAILQTFSYASFTRIDSELLAFTTPGFALVLWLIWRLRHKLDVLALGHDCATALGEPPERLQMRLLLLISLLVAISTALVGPATFFGLLTVSIAHLVTPTYRHAVLLPSAALVSVIVLVGGQAIMERVLKFTTPLSVVVDALGGAVFILLLLRGLKR